MGADDKKTLWIAAGVQRFFHLPPGKPRSGRRWLWSLDGECLPANLSTLARFEINGDEARAIFRSEMDRGLEAVAASDSMRAVWKRLPRLRHLLERFSQKEPAQSLDDYEVIAALIDRDADWLMAHPDQAEIEMNALATSLRGDLEKLVPASQSAQKTETPSPEAAPLADILADWMGFDDLAHLSGKSAQTVLKELWPWTDAAANVDLEHLKNMLEQLTANDAMDPSTVMGGKKMRSDIKQAVSKTFSEGMRDFRLPEIDFEDLLADSGSSK